MLYWAALSCGNVYYAAQFKLVLAFESVNEILKCDHSNLFDSTLIWKYETLEKIVEFVFGHPWRERVNDNDA